jgi:hypothetical protein
VFGGDVAALQLNINALANALNFAFGDGAPNVFA